MCAISGSNKTYKENKARTMVAVTGANQIYVASLDRVVGEGLSGKGYFS